MNRASFWRVLGEHARRQPTRLALAGGDGDGLSYGELPGAVARICGVLQRSSIRAPGLLAENGIAWALTDLAALRSGLPLVPLPGFFSDAQLRHIVATAALDAVITDDPDRAVELLGEADVVKGPAGLALVVSARAEPSTHATSDITAKITFTSGTTGTPRGVCLGAEALLTTADTLRRATGMTSDDIHLCLQPCSTLLENVGGLYRGLLAGGCVVLRPGLELGLSGPLLMDPERMATSLERMGAASTILVPGQLAGLLEVMPDRPGNLPQARFIGVGGAPVPIIWLEHAARLDLPVFEGYGLSEASSVVALNTAGAHRIGSVGRPLAHVAVRIAEDGEIHVAGAVAHALLGSESTLAHDGWLATGDLGELDEDGLLTVTGRRDDVFVTSLGRNVSPEWIEKELVGRPGIEQVAVLGQGCSHPWAVVVTAERQAVAGAVEAANRELPEYARVREWVVATEPFTAGNEQRGASGRLRREVIAAAYEAGLDRESTSSDQGNTAWASTKN